MSVNGAARLFSFVGVVSAFFASLGFCCYKLLQFSLGYLSPFWTGIDSDLYQFVGYVINFNLLWYFFTFYYFVLCTFVVSFIVTFSLELLTRFIPEACRIPQNLLLTLTGEG